MIKKLTSKCHEVLDIKDLKGLSATTTGDTRPPGIQELSDFKLIIEYLLPKDLKVNFTKDDIRLFSNLTINKTINITIQSFFLQITSL